MTANFIIADVNFPTILSKLICSEIGLIKKVVVCVDATRKWTSESNISQLEIVQMCQIQVK